MHDDDLREETNLDDREEPLETTEEEVEQQEEQKHTVKYNGQEQELSIDELKTLAQKGMNYDHVQSELTTLRSNQELSKADSERLIAALNQFGYQGTQQEIADLLEAQQREITPEEVKRERKDKQQQTKDQEEIKRLTKLIEDNQRQTIFEQDLAEIRTVNPNIKSIDELGDMFKQLRASGICNLDAYQIVSTKSGARKTDDSASKEHMKPTGGGKGAGDLVDIPSELLELWSESFPNATPKELKERYNRSLKRQGD